MLITGNHEAQGFLSWVNGTHGEAMQEACRQILEKLPETVDIPFVAVLCEADEMVHGAQRRAEADQDLHFGAMALV